MCSLRGVSQRKQITSVLQRPNWLPVHFRMPFQMLIYKAVWYRTRAKATVARLSSHVGYSRKDTSAYSSRNQRKWESQDPSTSICSLCKKHTHAQGPSAFWVSIWTPRRWGSYRAIEESVPGSDGLRYQVLLLAFMSTDLKRAQRTKLSLHEVA